MYTLIVKSLFLLWPFLKRAVFGNKTIKEVLRENRNVTFVFTVLIVISLSFSLALTELEDVRVENNELKRKILSVEVISPETPPIINRRSRLDDAL